MNTTAFLALEDISDNLPRYDESVISVDMDETLQQAYERLEEEIRSAMQEHRGNKSLMSILLNTLLLYPDHPYDFEEIWARAFDPQTKEFERFLVATPENLSREALYAKERALIADIKEELRQGRRCQVYATYTGEKDVTQRLETVLQQEGIRVAVLRSSVPTDKREDWYERQLKAGVEVVICHPKLVETGLDLLAFPTLYFYETGYSLHTLRQASRRSWRIGQRFPVRVKFVTYAGTMQETCLRLMGKKMLVALMMEGKFSGEGLQALDTDEDLMSAMARELVEKAGVSAYAEWTRQANGFGQEKDAQYDGQPDGWNEVYFELAAKCVAGLSVEALDQELHGLFAGMPDESLCDCLPIFLRSADQAFFEKNLLSIEQMIQIRTFLIHELSETRVFGWNKDRDEASAEMHLAHALGAICFNDYNSIGPSKCYLPSSFIPRADPFLPLIENFVGEFRSPFLAAMYLNFMEVAPRAEQLPFILGCVEKWLERFPDSNRFWIEMSFGGRIGSLLATIFHASPEAFEPVELRSRIDRILTQLVGLGVGEAHEMEKLLYQLQ